MPIPLNPNIPFPYVLKEDMDGYNAGQPVTVFQLKPMTIAERQAWEKTSYALSAKIQAGDGMKVENEAQLIVSARTMSESLEKAKAQTVELVRTHLMGWENFTFSDGTEAVCTEPGNLNRDSLQLIYPYAEELSRAIVNGSSLSRKDREK